MYEALKNFGLTLYYMIATILQQLHVVLPNKSKYQESLVSSMHEVIQFIREIATLAFQLALGEADMATSGSQVWSIHIPASWCGVVSM